MSITSEKKYLFYLYLALICWMPIPLASKPLLAQDFFIFIISLLSLVCCGSMMSTSSFPISFKKAWPALILFAITLLWLFIQSLSIPADLIRTVSPIRTLYTGFEHPPQTLTISFYPWASHHFLLMGISYFQLFMLTLLLVTTEDRLRILLYSLVILGVIQATYGGLMTLSGLEKQLWFDKEAHIGFATGTLINRNHLANYLTFAAASGIGLLLASTTFSPIHNLRQFFRMLIQWLLGPKGFLRLSLIIIVIGIILTRSRMGNTAFFFSLGSTAFIWLILSGRFSKKTFFLFCSLLIIDLFLVGMWFGVDKVAKRIETTNSEQEIRLQMTPYMIDMAKDFWLTGTGAGTFADTFPLYKQQMSTYWYNEAHNDYLQFLIEFGVIGIVPLCILVLLSFFKIYQTIRHRHSRLPVAVGFTTLMALTASGIHATAEYNLQRPATASLFVIFLALPWVTAHIPSTKRRRKIPVANN